MPLLHNHNRHHRNHHYANKLVTKLYTIALLSLYLTATTTNNSIVVQAEVCGICGTNATHIMNDKNALIVWPPGNDQSTGLSCSEIAEKAVKGYFNNCTVIHSYSDFICKCGVEEPPFTCPLCGTDSNTESKRHAAAGEHDRVLPDPIRVVAGNTCLGWQDYATDIASPADCPYYQKSLGSYCGCNENIAKEPSFYDGFCKLCEDKMIPDYNKEVTFTDDSKTYCVQQEIDVNTRPNVYNCGEEQDKFKKACGCDVVKSGGSNKSSSANEMVLSFPLVNVVSFLPLLFVVLF